MGVILTPPGSSVGVELADDLVERYEAQGWARVDSAPAEKYLSQQNKAELVATANGLGLDADESLSKKDLVELIESARAETANDEESTEAPAADSEQQ